MLSALGHCSLSSFPPLWELSAPPPNEAVCYVLTSGKQPLSWKALSILVEEKNQSNFLRWDFCAELELLLLVKHLLNVHQGWMASCCTSWCSSCVTVVSSECCWLHWGYAWGFNICDVLYLCEYLCFNLLFFFLLLDDCKVF